MFTPDPFPNCKKLFKKRRGIFPTSHIKTIHMHLLTRNSLMLAAGLLLPVAAFAQAVSYTNHLSYAQNFDGLSSSATTTANPGGGTGAGVGLAIAGTGMNGWYMRNDRGSSSSTEYRAHDGSLASSAGRGVVSFGTTGSTDRALGTLATCNQISTFAVILQNNTGYNLSQFSLGFTGEQWRAGEENLNNVLNFKYSVVSTAPSATAIGLNAAGFTAVNSLTFQTPFLGDGAGGVGTEVAVNGNLPQYQASLSGSAPVSWGAGQYLVLQWSGVDLSGQDNGIAIDNLSFSAIPEPSTYAAILGAAALGFAAIRRRRAAQTA